MVPDIPANGSRIDPVAKGGRLDEKAKLKLQKAVREFESIFVNYMLQNMRKTVQKSDAEGENFGGDMMQGMFDLEIAKHVSQRGSLGIGAMLYSQMTGEVMPGALGPNPARVASAPAQVASAPAQVRVAPKGRDSTATGVPRRLDQYADIIQRASGTFEINPNLIKAVMAAESAGNARAVSSKNAKGLMQLIDSTAAAMGVQDIWDPEENITGGARYLKKLLEQFDGNPTLAVASYNAGPGAVEKHGGIPPYTETRQYVNRVMNYFRLFEQQGVLSNELR